MPHAVQIRRPRTFSQSLMRGAAAFALLAAPVSGQSLAASSTPAVPASNNQARAEAEAQRLFAAKEQLGPQWLTWVAGELYALKPAAYASMVRRALQALKQ